MDYDAIRTQLGNLLTAVTQIAFVYDNREANIDGYPAIILDLAERNSETLTNTENLHKGIFAIYILQEVKVKGATLANTLLDAATQAVVTALEARDNMTLNGTVDWVEPVTGAREEVIMVGGAVLSQEIRCTVWRSISTI